MSNATSAWMHSVQRKYDLDGSLDTRSYYAGIPGVNIEGVEIRVFEETEVYTSDGPKTPTGDYKIINAPFICQYPDWPTGCESVSAVMALMAIKDAVTNRNQPAEYCANTCPRFSTVAKWKCTT